MFANARLASRSHWIIDILAAPTDVLRAAHTSSGLSCGSHWDIDCIEWAGRDVCVDSLHKP